MLWFEVSAAVPPSLVDALAALMRDVTPGGVTIEEPIDILGPERGFTVRGGEPVVVKAYFPAGELGAVLVEELRTNVATHLPAVELIARPLYQQDWAVSWREFFGPVDSGGRVVIVPSWVDYEAAPGRLIIRLDPGQAFGTGHHETTRLCLRALEELVQPGMGILDVGTGSGVLSIAALFLGASHATGLDIDPIAIEVAAANCTANGVLEHVSLAKGSLELDHPTTYPLVVANVYTEANISLAPAFGRAVAPGGHLVLSGVLAEDARRVAAAQEAEGFRLVQLGYERDWSLIVLKR